MTNWHIHIDTGGTFTDCIATDPEGGLHRTKVLSSSKLRGRIRKVSGRQLQISQSWGVKKDIFRGYEFVLPQRGFRTQVRSFEGDHLELEEKPPAGSEGEFELTAREEAPMLAARLITGTALEDEFPALQMRLGTTKGTNALLEHKGQPPLLVISRGFADLPLIGNQQRQDLFALAVEKPQPYHAEVFEFTGRIDQSGREEVAPEPREWEALKSHCHTQQVTNAAVVGLNSYKNCDHEEKIRAVLEDAGVPYITTSAAISPQINFQERCETAIVNAYLHPVLETYLEKISRGVAQLKVMTSAGGLVSRQAFHPKDSLLSGPAGGVVAAEMISRQCGLSRIITFDMGGTSSDVARYAGRFDYQYGTAIGEAHISGPALNIHTVAAGGGSVCSFDGQKFAVGPESGGAHPGPACYGAGGPLCLTDVNLLLGKMATDRFSIPLEESEAREQLHKLLEKSARDQDEERVLQGFLDIAKEKMAEAVRQISTARGYDPADYALLAFGGAGGMHACAVADLLEMKTLILPRDAGILSAYGIGQAREERFASREVLHPLQEVSDLPQQLDSLKAEARKELLREGYAEEDIHIRHVFCYLRFRGQEHSLEVDGHQPQQLEAHFEKAYRQLYGHYLEDRPIELARIKVVASLKPPQTEAVKPPEDTHTAPVLRKQKAWVDEAWRPVPVYDFEALRPGARLKGPGIVLYKTSTAFLEKNWQGVLDDNGTLIAQRRTSGQKTREAPEEVQLELFSNRFTGIAREMGALLQRTAFSVNVKERLDFSCALLDAAGDLIVNAPHIPVHLGALGVCVKEVVRALPLQEGDIAITNSPAYGGSHLPDVTLVAPIHYEGKLIGYAANRAHHAEIGGVSPGSMPADATRLAEEGVVLQPFKLVEKGRVQWERIEERLTSGPYPTRALQENLADLNAGLASLESGKRDLQQLFVNHGQQKVTHYMQRLQDYAHHSLWRALQKFEPGHYQALEKLDDGSRLQVAVDLDERLRFDFSGTGATHPRNLNANRAIVTSVILYVLRLIAREEIPLNEGLLRGVDIHLPQGSLLNPVFDEDPEKCPAVVGGNVEVSQRLTDTLLKAFGLAACSYGTMNNVLFGNEEFGFYETICGGVGATDGQPGADAVHQHMTNTRITDAEIMEWRYPVRVDRFAVRKNSGGLGKWRGGNGVIREITFKKPVTLTVLTQHRVERPYGLQGGEPGQAGCQRVIRANGKVEELEHIHSIALEKGDALVIETPGGGGFGKA